MALKLCGITNAEQLNFINTNGKKDGKSVVNFIGFVFYKNSPRYITPQDAQGIIMQALSDDINAVAVMVNPLDDEIVDAIKAGVKWFQIHFSSHFSQQIQQSQRLKTINFIKQNCLEAKFIMPFAISSASEISNIINDSTLAEAKYILLDAKTQNHGGSGQPFNWNIFSDLPTNIYNKNQGTLFGKPFFLSGGISQHNVLEGMRFAKNFDLSSSLEIKRGIKDLKKIESFLAFYKSLV